MRKNPTHKIEEYRITTGPMASSRRREGHNGAFEIPHPVVGERVTLRLVVSDGSGWVESGLPGLPWEHASVSLPHRTPTWEEMDWVKRLLWRDDECVMQLHVPRSDHISHHPYCLHLWKPIGVEIPRPPALAVGPTKEVTL